MRLFSELAVGQSRPIRESQRDVKHKNEAFSDLMDERALGTRVDDMSG